MSMTPFGTAVEPLVNMMHARDSGVGKSGAIEVDFPSSSNSSSEKTLIPPFAARIVSRAPSFTSEDAPSKMTTRREGVSPMTEAILPRRLALVKMPYADGSLIECRSCETLSVR